MMELSVIKEGRVGLGMCWTVGEDQKKDETVENGGVERTRRGA